MAAPTVSELPPAPVRGEDRELFATKGNDLLGSLAQFRNELNAVGSYINDQQIDLAIQKIDGAQQLLDDLQAETVGTPTMTQADFALGGDFHEEYRCAAVRIGNQVTLTIYFRGGEGIALPDMLTDLVSSANGVLPEQFRASGEGPESLKHIVGSRIHKYEVSGSSVSAGTIRLRGLSMVDGSSTDIRTARDHSLSYNIIDDVVSDLGA